MSGSGGVRLYRCRNPTQYELDSHYISWGTSDLLIVDESNSFSSKDDDRRRHLTVVCCRVRDIGSFQKVAENLPVRKGVRTKYSNTRDPGRYKVLKAIAEQYVVIVESHRVIGHSVWESAEAKKRLYMRVLSDAVNKALDADQGHTLDVILDTPPVNIDPELVTFARHLGDVGEDIRWFETRQSASDQFLQIHDFITGVVSDHIEGLDAHGLYDLIEGHVVE